MAAARSIHFQLLVPALVAAASGAEASQLIPPSTGVPDGAMNAATVAAPLTPTSAAFANPAAITTLAPGSASLGLGIPVGHSQVHTTTPPGYDTTNDFLAYAPEAGAVFETESGWRWGVAMYGSLGSSFDSDADAAAGVPYDFYSSAGVSNAGLMLALPLGDRWSIGAGLQLLYGQVHLRYFQFDQFAYTLRGPGLQANVGVHFRATDRVSLGASFRTPGMVWTDGDDRLPGGAKQDVDLDLDMPAQVFLGLNADVTDRLHVGLSTRWTDASSFSGSIFRFSQTPGADIPYIGGASDEWRVSGGARYALTETFDVAGGVGWADAVVPDTWVSPLLVDSPEWKITFGASWQLPGSWSAWTVDATVGISPTGARNVSDSEAVVFPGRYTIGGEIYLIGLRTTL